MTVAGFDSRRLRGLQSVVRDQCQGRALPLVCFTCKKAHAVKTYHVVVDHEGFTIVSPQVWRLMRDHNAAGFSVANEVATPPGQIVGFAPVHVDVTPLEN